MKVVINRCYGGFGLSPEAMHYLAETECTHIEKCDPKEYYGSRDDWHARFLKDSNSESAIMTITVHKDKILIDNHRSTYGESSRHCSYLVQVVEDLEEEADSWASELKVVEIPDGTDYTIDKYDGIESIEEKHASWS